MRPGRQQTIGAVGQDAAFRELLRRRARAQKDEKPGAASEAQDRLRDSGIVVRDRDGVQQYRVTGA